MSTLTRIAGISLCIALRFSWSAPASAASSQSDSTTKAPAPTPAAESYLQSLIRSSQAKAQADSMKAAADSLAADSSGLAALAAALAPIDRFVPVSTSRVESNDIYVALGTKLNVILEPGKGWKLMGDMGVEQTRYRQREMEDITEMAMGQADKMEANLYRLGVQASDNYSKKTTLGLGRYGQDIVFTDTGAKLDFAFLKPLLGASQSDITVKGGGSKGTHDFKYDRTYAGSASSTMQYFIGPNLMVKGGGGVSGKHETSYIGPIRYGPLNSNADSVRASMGYGKGQTKTVEVAYNWLKGVDRKVMPPLGNAYEILNDPSLAKQEEARNRAEQLIVNAYLQPFSYLGFTTNFRHAKATQKYQVDTRLSMESEENSIDATASYRYARRGTVQFGVSTSDDVWDYGPVSLSSFRERQHVLSVGVSQKVGDSVSVNLSGSGSLKQRFYLKQDVNPRDADYLFYRGDFTLRAPHAKYSADISCTVDRYETINIDNTLSGDNRVDYKYQLGPRFTLKPARWLTLAQDYIIKIEFTDFVFTEDKNYLNRTTTMNTRAYFNVFRSLKFDFLHSYLKKDTGSYLMRETGRKYSPSNETFEHTLNMAANYQVIPDFLVKAESDFRIQRGNVFASRNGQKFISSSTVYESGGMKVGFERKVSFGERGGLTLDIAYVRNYGPYITPARKEYWQADSELTLRF